MWITYDPNGAFPQVPQPGIGIESGGQHNPPAGLASFEVNIADLEFAGGGDEVAAFYEVTAPDTLTPKDQAERDEITKAVIVERKVDQAIAEASRRRLAVVGNLAPGGINDFVALLGRALASVRRDAKGGRPNPGEEARLDALEALADQIDAIDTARDTIIAEIESSPDPASIDVPNSPHWPQV